jgi:hypothetical protein
VQKQRELAAFTALVDLEAQSVGVDERCCEQSEFRAIW